MLLNNKGGNLSVADRSSHEEQFILDNASPAPSEEIIGCKDMANGGGELAGCIDHIFAHRYCIENSIGSRAYAIR